MMTRQAIITMVVTLLTCSGSVWGQRITVQQPVVQQFGVSTVVSVPDRGSLMLGGVGSAASGSRRSAIFGPGSTYGSRTAGSAISVHATIHDFEAMDRALLGQGTSAASPSSRGPADIAYRQLLDRHRRLFDVRSTPTDRAPRQPTRAVSVADDRAGFYLAKARHCEEQGKTSVAEMFYRMAARYGSSEAADHLAQGGAVSGRKP